ncbi:uncharacterized protein M421DRAFT_4962 [Didymella exigua CBS 183.55]|uniref:MFS general substrate transporter n=1 Tax=Didymella exigua CBS 183.55 TaxID=1150837 RepID=A0A6A5RMJ0_9PLEO|nr:uncharacterized protein M421DRAFT_4962 [Didymella exigua CBS 183.55]KAF1928490.1 hypothetical protein M421DRAFT_4962 [Didymella exigua CBS 183.55]
MQIIKRSLSKFSLKRFAALFENRTMAITTCLLWFQWKTVGMAYPLFNAFLPQYLAKSGGDVTNDVATAHRNYAITAIVGVPGSLLACCTGDLKYTGGKGTMAFGTLVTGIFVFLFTISSDSDFQLAFTCLEAFFQNIIYGVLRLHSGSVSRPCLFIATFFIMLLLPIETRGKQTL